MSEVSIRKKMANEVFIKKRIASKVSIEEKIACRVANRMAEFVIVCLKDVF